MKYVFILLLFSCTIQPDNALFSISEKEKSSYVVLNRPEFPDDYHQIEYIGNWTHMNNEQPDGTIQTGSYANTENDTARYEFWGYGIQVRTELMEHHDSVEVRIDHKHIETINVKSPGNTTNNLIYSNMELITGNHVLELIPDGGYFVLNTLTIHYYVDPKPDEDCISDTVYLPNIDTAYFDSTRWETKINWIDSVRLIEKDTTIFHYKDSTIYHHVYDTTGSRIDTVFIIPRELILNFK